MKALFNPSETAQLIYMAAYINATPALKRAINAKDWTQMVTIYNGSANSNYITAIENEFIDLEK